MWTSAQLIAAAIEEDVGSGDLTSQFFIAADERGEARIIARESGVLAGVGVAAQVFRTIDPTLAVTIVRADGEAFGRGESVLTIAGRTASILTAERTALNFLQRLSGVATLTRRFVEAVAGTSVKILDTRKTTPGWRLLEKAAVRAGGGQNHRVGLYDMVMVKDNHLPAAGQAGDWQSAIDKVKAVHPGIRVEFEADGIDQVRAFLNLRGIDVILLDNMTIEELKTAVQLVRESSRPIALEASGGVTLESVRAIAETGVDFISCGALTHSARAIDFSLELER